MNPFAFLELGALTTARSLLGAVISHETPEGLTSGRIVETEAYTQDDPASHSFGRRTARNEVMYGEAGHAYVYRIHQAICFNVVTGTAGTGEAVLIRALEPLEGIPLMRTRRGTENDRLLCAGPGRLCQAMAITMADNGTPLWLGPLLLIPGTSIRDDRVMVTPRIGIRLAAEWPRRFSVAGSRCLSRFVASAPVVPDPIATRLPPIEGREARR